MKHMEWGEGRVQKKMENLNETIKMNEATASNLIHIAEKKRMPSGDGLIVNTSGGTGYENVYTINLSLVHLLSLPLFFTSLAFFVLMSSLIQLMYAAYLTSVYRPAVMVSTLEDRHFSYENDANI